MSSMRFKTGSQREIQAVALNKTGTQCSYQCFPPEFDVCVCVCVCVCGGGEVAGYCVCGGGGRWRAYSGDYTAKTVTLPSGI